MKIQHLITSLLVLLLCTCKEGNQEQARSTDSAERQEYPGSQFWNDEAELSRLIVGRWMKDESYSFGRFVGEAIFDEDGKCVRKFGIYDEDESTLKPIVIERGRWEVDRGYICFVDMIVEPVDPTEADYKVKHGTPDEREWVMKLTADELRTVDEKDKIDIYDKVR